MQRKVIEKVKTVPRLPRGIKSWIDREIVPVYAFYTYSKDRKEMGEHCTVHKQTVKIPGIEHNAKGSCPYCSKAVTYESRGRRGTVIDKEVVQALQKISEKELVVRSVRVYRKYPDADMPEDSLYESARIFINSDREGRRKPEHFYHQFSYQDITP